MSARASVTCPQCGSLVPVGDRKCDNCGARQKDFAPAPQSYVRPDVAPVTRTAPPAPPRTAPSPAVTQPAVTQPAVNQPAGGPTTVTPPDDYRPLAHRGTTGTGPAAPPTTAPVTGYAVPATPPGNPYATPPADPYAKAPVTPYAPGSHAQGAPSGAASAPSVYTAADGASPGRSGSASRALIFSLIPVGVNVVVFLLIWLSIVIAGGAENLESDAIAGGILLAAVSGLLGALANLVCFLLALVFGIIGLKQTAGRAMTGRWRAVLAIVIVAWHVLLVIGFFALAVN
jgi:hypothetical protein